MMKGADRLIFGFMALAAVAVAFWFLALSPKRQEAAKLSDEVTELEDSVSAQEQAAEFGEQARSDYPRHYGRLVSLGKAVPDQADTASMIVQVNRIADRADVEFREIELAESSGSGGAAPAPASTAPAPGAADVAPSVSAPPAEGETAASAPATPTAAPAPATEAAAASLPIGATVGAAGLPILPYSLSFEGGFFEIADFIHGIDQLVNMGEGDQVVANGRLLTIDAFVLKAGGPGFPTLDAHFATTSYATPSGQGLTAGATPTGPALDPAQPQATPASAEVTP